MENTPNTSIRSCGPAFKTERGAKKCKKNLPGNAIARELSVIAAKEVCDEPLVWGSYTMADIELVINATYEEFSYWRRNIYYTFLGHRW